MSCAEISNEAIWALLDEKLSDLISFDEFCDRLRTLSGGWQPISANPRDGAPFLGMSADDRWPQPMKWEAYSAEDAEEIGEDGFWTYCEELIAEVVGGAEPIWWRPMLALPAGGPA